MSKTTNRVFITGLGITSPMGHNLPSHTHSLKNGLTHFSQVDFFDVTRQRVQTAGIAKLPETQNTHNLSPQHYNRLDRGTKLLLHATAEALKSANLTTLPTDTPYIIGTSAGAMPIGEAYYKQATTSLSRKGQLTRVENYQPQRSAASIQKALGIHTHTQIISNACASGANAIGHAFSLIRNGKTDIALAGGYDALAQMVFAGFDTLQALAVSGIPRPFDEHREGLAIGEGAAILILESEKSALARGATILAEITGYGIATDLHHLTQPHPEGLAAIQSMTQATEQAGLTPADIQYINSHGTGTPLNDIAEAHAITTWAGKEAAKNIMVSSTKSATGHALGGAGAIETAICILALTENIVPASLNIRTPDPATQHFDLVTKPRTQPLNTVLTNSFGFGGCNATLILQKEAKPQQSQITNHESNLFIHGHGAVTAAGPTPTDLHNALTQKKQLPTTPLERTIGETKITYPTRPVDTKALRAVMPKHPRLRRASNVTKFATTAAHQAIPEHLLEKIKTGQHRLGIILTFINGCVNYSNRFFTEVLNDPSLASPILFPETVFNAPAGHIAAFLGSTGPAYTLLGDSATWNNATHIAQDWIDQDLTDGVLILCAEELDWLSTEALTLYKKGQTATEGATAIYLETNPSDLKIETSPPITHTNKTQHQAALVKAQNALDPDTPTITTQPTDTLGNGLGINAGLQTITAIQHLLNNPTQQKIQILSPGENQQTHTTTITRT